MDIMLRELLLLIFLAVISFSFFLHLRYTVQDFEYIWTEIVTVVAALF
jgi:hypothetical protein